MSMLGIAGFALMILIVALLLWGKSTPAVVFILLPIITGFVVGFTPAEMSGYIAAGVSGVATTLLIAIPPLLPIYKKMKVRPINLLCITTLTMGVMNIVPWGGPCGRTAAALEVSTSEIWKYCIPAQIFGLVLILSLCILLARNEKKRGAGYVPGGLPDAPAGHPVMCLPCCESLAGPAPLWARWGTTCLGGC